MKISKAQFLTKITPYLDAREPDDILQLAALTASHELDEPMLTTLLAVDSRHWATLLGIPKNWFQQMELPGEKQDEAIRYRGFFLRKKYHLTERELELWYGMSLGMTYPQLAHKFVISETTVKTHTNNIFVKLGVHDRTKAVCLAHAYNYPPAALLRKHLTQKAAA